MIHKLFNWFAKITGWPIQLFTFTTKIHYEDQSVQGRRIHGPALIISNHTSIFDFAVYLFVFPWRTCRYLMAEVIYDKPFLRGMLKLFGGIRVDRNSYDMGFIQEAVDILEEGGVVGVFPESRLPLPGEEKPLPFKESAALIALMADVPVIPVVTDGAYFTLKKRANVLIGTPLRPSEIAEEGLTDRENIARVTEVMREKIKSLGALLDERKEKK